MRVFVLMPFDDEFDALFEKLLKPKLEAEGYKVERGDTLLDQQNVLKDIVSGIALSDIIIADLTGLNPNVMYELGIAHALNKPTVILTQTIEELPFDLRAYRATEYSLRFDKVNDLAEFLARLAREHANGKVNFSNPVSDFAPISPTTPGELASNTGLALSTPIETSTSEPEELGFLDHLNAINAASTRIAELTTALGSHTKAIGERFTSQSKLLNALNESQGPDTAAQAFAIVTSTSKDLHDYAIVIAPLSHQLKVEADKFSAATLGYTGFLVGPELNIDAAQARRTRSLFAGLSESLRSALPAVRGFRNNMSPLRIASGSLSKAVKEADSSLADVSTALETTDATCWRAISMLDNRFGHPASLEGMN